MQVWRHRVTSPEEGGRLDRFLQTALPELTRSRIKRLVTEGYVRVDGSVVKAGHRLRAGERLEVEVPPPPAVTPEPEDLPVSVVYEDADLLVVDKAAGMTVHPGAGRPGGTLVNALLGRGTPLSPMGAPQRPGIVHRLDRGTSGLLVVAKTEPAHRTLAAALAARGVHRRYWALVWGEPRPASGEIVASLARSRADRRRIRVVASGGRHAVTRYRVLARAPEVSAVALTLETGRTHQIRVHFKHLGHPVFGDPEYGGRGGRVARAVPEVRDRVRRALAALPRQALHAAALAFVHPRTGENLHFESALPDDILRAAVALGVPGDALQRDLKEDA